MPFKTYWICRVKSTSKQLCAKINCSLYDLLIETIKTAISVHFAAQLYTMCSMCLFCCRLCCFVVVLFLMENQLNEWYTDPSPAEAVWMPLLSLNVDVTWWPVDDECSMLTPVHFKDLDHFDTAAVLLKPHCKLTKHKDFLNCCRKKKMCWKLFSALFSIVMWWCVNHLKLSVELCLQALSVKSSNRTFLEYPVCCMP